MKQNRIMSFSGREKPLLITIDMPLIYLWSQAASINPYVSSKRTYNYSCQKCVLGMQGFKGTLNSDYFFKPYDLSNVLLWSLQWKEKQINGKEHIDWNVISITTAKWYFCMQVGVSVNKAFVHVPRTYCCSFLCYVFTDLYTIVNNSSLCTSEVFVAF